MATNVTVLGVAGAVVSVPFSSAANAAAAQTAANVISQYVTAGTLTQTNYVSGTTVPAAPSLFGGVVISVPGGTGSSTLNLPQNYLALTDTSAGQASVQSASGTPNATVIAGQGTNLTYFNQGINTAIYTGGGNFSFIEEAGGSAVLNVDESNVFVGAAVGSTTVNVYDQTAVNILGGGSVVANAVSGTATFFLTGNSTVPVTINDAGATGLSITEMGGSAMVNPGSANVTVFGGTSGGSVSVFGANSLAGGTGALSVFGGSGYFVGGSAGPNVMTTSTIAGATTLIGGAGNDSLYGLGAGDILRSTSGKDLMASYSSGDTLIAGTGTATMYGANTGNNTFVFDGAGTSSAYGAYGNTTIPANLYTDSVGGGTITINDFRSGTDKFHIADGATITSNTFTTGGPISYSTVKLSDNTTITFNYTQVKTSDFS
jgi:serralysin